METPGSEGFRMAGERWSKLDDPGRSPEPLSASWSDLPTQGTVKRVPWPGYAWETFRDSLNYTWAGQGTLSATAKYARVFGIDNLEHAISKLYGVAHSSTVARCSSDDGCRERERCGFYPHESQGFCIPEWWGLCHAWSNAAIVEPEPVLPVTLDGVTFEPNDIKGLLTLVYDRSEFVFVSQRCWDSHSRGEVELDAHGRPEPECRDINPGAFHIYLANYVGLMGRSIIADLAFDSPVGNLPIYSYRVDASKKISLSEARTMVGEVMSDEASSAVLVDLSVAYVLSSDAQDTGDLSSRVSQYLKPKSYRYVLELDSDGSIIGGEWVGESKTEHPDFLQIPMGPGRKRVAAGLITYDRVKQLVDASAKGSTLSLERVRHQSVIAADEWKTFGPFEVAPSGRIEASLTSEQDVELYMYRGDYVSSREYACRRRHAQTNTPCAVEGPGPVWVRVLGKSFDARFELTVLYGRTR
jgi:hypothetical protein